jgi:hypothetical protein
VKKIANAAKFLQQTGLLMEINRVVLHPRGLALSVAMESENVTGFGPLLDVREGAGEGWIFDEGWEESVAQLRAAESDGRCPILPGREKALGFVIQPLPEEDRG